MVAPVFDQFAVTGGWGGTSSHTNAWTLAGGAKTNELMVLGVSYSQTTSAPTTNSVSTVTDTDGHVWTKLTAQSFISAPDGSITQNVFTGLEVWYAYGSWSATGSISVTLAGAPDHANFLSFLASGVNVSKPWDANASLPAVSTVFATSAAPTMSVTTSTANVLVIAMNTSPIKYDTAVTFGGAAQDFGAQSAYSAGGVWFQDININGKAYTAAQSGLSVAYGVSTNQLALAIALTADAQIVVGTALRSFGSMIS